MFKYIKEFNKDDISIKEINNFTEKDNLILKWDNLIVMKELKDTFFWKVKMIYIDPPYNTGNRHFNYIDKFQHKEWLNFMEERLILAKDFLKEDWLIFNQIDDQMHAYLKILMDSIFWMENFVGNIIWRKRAGWWNDSKHLSIEHENILFYAKNINKLKTYWKKREKISHYKKDEKWYYLVKPLNDKSLKDSPWLHYDIYLPNKKVLLWKDHQWKMTEKKFLEKLKNNWIIFTEKWTVNYKHYVDIEKNIVPSSILYDLCLNAEWTKELKALFWEKVFSTPKPEKLIQFLIEYGTTENDIVMDFFLGSWTTTAVAHKMDRQYIGIEKMDYIEEIAIERMLKVMNKEVFSKKNKSFIFWEF